MGYSVYGVPRERKSPPARSLGPFSTLLCIQANFSSGPNALEQSSPIRTDFRDETSCLEKRRLVSCAVDVSLVVSPWSAGWRPLLPSLVVRRRVTRLADSRQYTHRCKHIVELESRGEAVRKLNRCCSMHDGGAVYHDVDLGALSTSAGALLCRILLN
jgi:hypothetical protein